MKLSFDFNLRLSGVIKYFILSDLVLIAGWGMVEPLFAVFIRDTIPGATLATVGTSAAVYWLTKSLAQLPIARFLDNRKGEEDDFYALVVSLILAGISALLFLAVRTPAQLYAVQVIHGLAFAVYSPAWLGIFSRHLDKERRSFEWALDSTAVGVSAGIAGFIGGFMVEGFGYQSIFIVAGVLSLTSSLFILSVPKLLLPPRTTRSSVLIPDKKSPRSGT